MNVLVIGATGLIGSTLSARLEADGHTVTRIYRSSRGNDAGDKSVIVMDMTDAVRPEDWAPALVGIDAVVNCAGALQDNARDTISAVQGASPSALFLACEEAGVRKVIHFSAMGVDRMQPSAFSASKLVGDLALMERELDWVILRPSVVLGRPAFGASALFRGLAALPFLPVMPATGLLQVVQLDDVVDTVRFFLEPDSPSRLAIDMAGPEALTMSEVVMCYRRWFGWKPGRRFPLPAWIAQTAYLLGDAAGLLGWRPPIRSNAGKEIGRGATADTRHWRETTGIRPLGLQSALAAHPPTVQERWFARLYFIKPAIFVALPFFWIATGIISLTAGWRNGLDLLDETAIAALAVPAVAAGALADIAVGVLIAWRPTSRIGLWGAIAVSVGYVMAGTLLRPDLWAEPLGPFLKVLPILILHFVALAILEER